MSYSIYTIGTKDEATRGVVRLCDSNSSPEMPVVKSFLLALLDSVEGDDKRIAIDANGSHYSGTVTHHITFRTHTLPEEPKPETPVG